MCFRGKIYRKVFGLIFIVGGYIMRKTKLLARILGLSLGALSLPFMPNSVVQASTVDPAQSAFNELCNELAEKGGYDSSKSFDEIDGIVYIYCLNGNVAKRKRGVIDLIESSYKKSLELMLRELSQANYYAAPPVRQFSKTLKRFDGRSMSQLDDLNNWWGFLPGLPTGWRVSGVVTFDDLVNKAIKDSEKLTEKEKKENLKFMRESLGDSVFDYYKNNCDRSYDFDGIAAALCKYAKTMEDWCEELRIAYEDKEYPIQYEAIGLIKDWKYDKGFGRRSGLAKWISGERKWGHTCVNNTICTALNLLL
jgi:hypothetical protein